MIWAQSVDGCTGKDGAVAWDLYEDLMIFRAMTLGKTVVMGRKT
jgi:dihydrofolate reductase